MDSEKIDSLDDQMQRLCANDMTGLDRHTTCYSVATAVLRGCGCRKVADNRAADAQVEPIPWAMLNLAAIVFGFDEVPAFCSLELVQVCW